MLRKLLIVGVSAGVSASVPIIYQANPDMFGVWLKSVFSEEAPDPQAVSAIPGLRLARAETPALLGRKVLIPSDNRGHFAADFKLNGPPIDGAGRHRRHRWSRSTCRRRGASG